MVTPSDLDPRRVERLLRGCDHAPGEWLGLHVRDAVARIAAYVPDAVTMRVVDGPHLATTRWAGLFVWYGAPDEVRPGYRLEWCDANGRCTTMLDAFAFAVSLDGTDLYLFNEGSHRHAGDVLGAHPMYIDGQPGTRFAVWAPNAERVSVVGDFNGWDGRRHPMNAQGSSGVWCLFVPELGPGERYKFEIRNRAAGTVALKADPYARASEHRPQTASVIAAPTTHVWQDDEWLRHRATRDPLTQPISIYEVHLGSWRRASDGTFLDYRTLAVELVRHVHALGFTHVELLPITEHPFDASWGYQSLGYFTPTNRFGSADDLKWFVDHCHRNGIGVILDWVPAHFPRDGHGLARFDGSALYEHADPRLGEHRDWNTMIFNYGRNEVRSFLTSSALYWLKEFHFDGLRVDAVASMLYLDYSREPGEWLPNRYGGRENLDAISWLRELNVVTHADSPGTIIVAEESTAWPGVSQPTDSGGLGFTLKWNMGWMNDTLSYMALDPIHRAYEHRKLTFGMLYAYSENFVLPLSHDEVVHGKRSLLAKMPGDDWQKFANLRLLLTYQATMPGKKLLFMGNELAQWHEWDHGHSLQWHLLDHAPHRGVFDLVTALNRLYRDDATLHVDTLPYGFAWIDCDDAASSTLSFQRRCGNDFSVVILNFTPVPRQHHRVGVPEAGDYLEIFNSDSAYFGGSNLGNAGRRHTDAVPCNGFPQSLQLTLPPLAGVIFKRDRTRSDAT